MPLISHGGELRSFLQELLRQDSSLADPIKDTTALAASLAAISVAIFIILPTFHSVIRLQGAPAFSEYATARRIIRGLHVLAVASGLFCAAVIVGIPGRHFPCRLVLYFQEAASAGGMLLFLVAIYIVWKSTATTFDEFGVSRRRDG